MAHALQLPRVSAPLAQALRFSAWAVLLFGLLYAPYAAGSVPVRMLSSYIEYVAQASVWWIGLGDASARLVDGTLITGRFPMQIVLDCTALDVQALYVAAVLSTECNRALGVLVGCAVLNVANLLRIVLLYWIGVAAPAQFELLHEDVLTFAMLACACGSFWVFTRWSTP